MIHPTHYEIIDGVTYFRYSTKDLKTLLKTGQDFILKRDGRHYLYSGEFNGIRYKFTIVHNDLFHGKQSTDDEIINPTVVEEPKMPIKVGYLMPNPTTEVKHLKKIFGHE